MIKKIFSVIVYPILLITVEWFMILLFSIIFNNNTSFVIGSNEYVIELSKFLANNKLIISLLSFIILIPILLKRIDKPKNIIINMPLLIIIGILFSLIFNLLLYSLNIIFSFTNIFDLSDNNLIVSIISIGIIGPILEELVFRGITYNRLKLITSKWKAIMITSLLFGIFHGNIVQFIYTFIFSIILTYIYDYEKNIFAPIIMHVSANISTILLMLFIRSLNIYYSLSLFLIFMIFLLIIMYKNKNIVNSNNVNEN